MVTTTQGPLPGRHTPAWLTPERRHALAAPLGAALLILLALLSTGGVLTDAPQQVPNSWVDAILVIAGGCAIGAFVIRRRDGGGTLGFALFAALAGLSAVSIAWSVAPDQSWEESGRTVAYLAVFGIALLLGRRSRTNGGSRGMVLTVTLAALGLCIWALAVKALDLDLYGQRVYGPLLAPFDYWNATGAIGAMALAGSVHLAARGEGRRLTRGLAVAGITIGASVVALTYSRSALAAGVIAAVIPLFFIRERRRAVMMLTLGVLGAVPVWVFAASNHDISADLAGSLYGLTSTLPVHRAGAGLVLGAIVLVTAALLTLIASALSGYLDTHPQPARRLLAYDRGLAGLLAAVPALIVLWLLVNHRGPFGEISHIWHSLVDVPAGGSVGGGVSRVGDLANSRSLYWREAFAVGEHHLLGGSGVGSFTPAYLHYKQATLSYSGQGSTDHAHSYVMETFATLGLAGIVLSLGLFCAWWRDAVRAVRHADLTDRGARWALIGVVLAFGVSSTLDYTWFFPGVAVPGLVAAGWVAGVSGRRRSAETPLATPGPARPGVAPPRPLSARPGAIIALTLVVLATLAIAWESLQPMRSTQSIAASLNAQEAGDGTAALADASSAVSEDPLSALALDRLAAVYGALHRNAQEHAELVKATQVQPDNPQPFDALGSYLLCSRHQYAAALIPLERTAMLDLTNVYDQTALLAAARTHQAVAAACTAA